MTTSAPPVAMAISHLSKRYGSFLAVRDLTLEVHTGEILGFLGLNGAGKTTTIRMLLDLLRPSAGRATIFDHDCQAAGLRARALIGYLPGEMGGFLNLTGIEVLDLLAGLGGPATTPPFRRELQERLELSDTDLRRKLREYSTGMKRKLGIIQAFQMDPPLLILDEPTEGLDPLMQESFYRLLADAKSRGRTVFMSSHVLSEVERVCDRVALMRGGALVILAPVNELRRMAPRRVRITFETDVAVPADLPPNHAWIEQLPREWHLEVTGALGPLIPWLGARPIEDIAIDEPRLEDVLKRHYREAIQ